VEHPLIVESLLIAGVSVAWFSVIGLILMRDFYERLHFLAPISTLGILCITAGIVVNELGSQGGIKAVLCCVAVLVLNPVLTQATARAGRVRDFGRWTIRPEEMRKQGAPAETEESD
jgi:monovalent cation/proton antiporter MnhG/PhaG subunit